MATTNTVLLAGGIAAFTVDLLIYPLDTLKTRLQAEPNLKLNRSLLRGLYQGVGSVIVATLPASGAFFTTYEHSNRILGIAFPSIPTPLIHAGSSAIAESISCAILCPAEVIKQNAQVASSSESGFLHIFRSLPSSKALFKGYTAMIARNLPNVALQFPLFEYLRSRSHLTTVPEGKGRKYVWDVVKHNAVSAGLAAGMASVFTNPIDLVKTKVMLQATKRDGHDGYREMVRKIWREEGMKGFWRGGGMRVAWMAVGGGTYLGSYQGAKVWLGGEPETGDTEELL